ncbi:MAG: hypothetical protein GF344_18880 [Chitinivibrionales bacterium]|nr:hypothetical protein [Chitinivibrionales bacterium]
MKRKAKVGQKVTKSNGGMKMPHIAETVTLNCNAQRAFEEIGDLGFIRKLNPDADIDNQLILQNERIKRYKLSVKSVGEWVSERIMVPESLTMITHRMDPLNPFQFLIVLHHYQEIDGKTLLTYKEEFEMDENHKSEEPRVFESIAKRVKPNLQKIARYFDCNE